MTALIMYKLSEALAKEGFVVKEIKGVEYDSYHRPSSGEKYTGEISIRVRPTEDEEAEAKIIRLRKEKEREALKPVPKIEEIDIEEVKF